MKTFEEYLSGVARQGAGNVLFEAGMYSLLNELKTNTTFSYRNRHRGC